MKNRLAFSKISPSKLGNICAFNNTLCIEIVRDWVKKRHVRKELRNQ